MHDEKLRDYAAGAIRQIGDKRAVEPLLATLHENTDQKLLGSVVQVVERIADPSAIPAMTALADAPATSPWLRERLLTAVKRIEDATRQFGVRDPLPDLPVRPSRRHRSHVPQLIDLLNHHVHETRGQAARWLGQIGDPRATPALIAAMRRGDNWNLTTLAEAIGHLGDPAAVPILFSWLGDPDSRPRLDAPHALSYLEQIARGILVAMANDAINGIEHSDRDAPDNWRLPSVNSLVAALHYPDQHVRNAAAAVIARLRDRESPPDLIQSLQHPNPIARRAAAEALGSIGDPASIPPLITALSDRAASVRRAAARSLARLGSPAVDGLVAVLAVPNSRPDPTPPGRSAASAIRVHARSS